MISARSLLLCVSLATSLTAVSAQAQGVFSGVVHNPDNNHYYLLLQNSTITDARAAAAGLGGYLTTINDAAENEFVRANLANYAGVARRIWIGLTDEVTEGTYLWMNGEPATYFNWQVNPAQPDNNLGRDPVNGEDYVEMIDATNGQWNDQPSCCNVGVEQATIFGCVEFDSQPSFGACCAPAGCSISTPAGCGGSGGQYRGDGSNCSAIYNGAQISGPFTPNLPIGPNAGTVTTDTETLAGAASIGGMNLNVQLTHTYIGDLTIDLRNEATGTVVRVYNQLCAGNDNLSITFVDGAPAVVCGTPTTGTYSPSNPLSAFTGQSATGAWSLIITDNANVDGGTLNSWSVTTYTSVTPNICSIPACGTADFDGDTDVGTDQDIEAFFRCLAGNCCATCYPGGADFNNDGDSGTDADIESFFRVLAGGPC